MYLLLSDSVTSSSTHKYYLSFSDRWKQVVLGKSYVPRDTGVNNIINGLIM